jgi:hypothetical protein
MANVKVTITEKDGVDLPFPEEHILTASDIPTTSGSSVQEVIDSSLVPERVSVTLSHNGSIVDNDWVGFSSLIPSEGTPVVVPWNCILEKVTFSNTNTSVDGEFAFYKNGTTVGDKIYTEVFTNVNIQKIFSPNIVLAEGDSLRLKWKDTGQNPYDTGLVLFFQLT